MPSTRFLRPRAVRVALLLASTFVVSACGETQGTSTLPELTIGAPFATTLDEDGGSTTVTVQLDAPPSSPVTVPVTTSDATEATASPASLTFDATNWDEARTITVTGVDDPDVDGDQNVRLILGPTASTASDLAGLVDDSLVFDVVDDDVAGFVVGSASGPTTEAGGTATFTLRLASRPAGNVTVTFGSDDPSEGTTAITSTTFHGANWNAPRTITVTGVDDASADGNVTYAIAFTDVVASDPSYDALPLPASVTFTNTDDESAGISITRSGAVTTEGGGTATIEVVLNAAPTADVTIHASSNDTTEAGLAPPSLTFTASNWSVPQTFTVTGVDDATPDGDAAYEIVFAAPSTTDATYAALAAPTALAFTNLDDDSPGIVVATVDATTSETGGTGSFTVALRTAPTADVTIAVASLDPSEGTLSTGTLTFTTSDWNVPQVVTVTGVDDASSDGNVTFGVRFQAPSSADAGYAALAAPSDLTFSNVDDDLEYRIRTTYSESGSPFYLAHSWFHGVIARLTEPAITGNDFIFRVVPGLSDPDDPDLVSFEARDYPGRYLRIDSSDLGRYPITCPGSQGSAYGWALCMVAPSDRTHLTWVDPYVDSASYRADATFRRVAGLDGNPSHVSFQWVPDATRYLRHNVYQVFAYPTSTAGERIDASFTLEPVSP